MTRPTIKALEVKVAELQALSDSNYESGRKWRGLAEEREKQVTATREQFADLKKRLHNSEMEVARLNGYLSRVREDDVVREDLVTTGDPEGGQRLVPKRKHEYLGNRESNGSLDAMMGCDSYGNRREKPKHWIEY
jgi:hypothetical protein